MTGDQSNIGDKSNNQRDRSIEKDQKIRDKRQ